MPDTPENKTANDKKSVHSHSQSTEVVAKKKTVLEGHGYFLGNPIGSGTYATVKVNINNCYIIVYLTLIVI